MNESVSVPKFPQATSSASLHSDLRKRVQAYFDEQHISSAGTTGLFTKAILLTSAFIALYIHLVFFTPSVFMALVECVIAGGLIAAIGFNVLHDGCHGSFSKYPFMNRLAASSISLLGANHFMWNMKHNMIHHTYTNIDGFDDDIETGILMRLAPTQQKLGVHRFQHLYFWVLYMFLYIFWIFFSDYHKYFTKKIGAIPLKKMNLSNHLIFWVVKLYHLAFFVMLPIYKLGFGAWLMGFLIASFIAGFTLSIVFQLAHTVEDTTFPMPIQPENKLENEFAIHQIQTTANFATHNKLVSWLVGGLNFQIEHHLFPKISHVHYPALSKIVKAVCEEHHLTYIEYPTVRKAITAHVRFLKQIGKLPAVHL